VPFVTPAYGSAMCGRFTQAYTSEQLVREVIERDFSEGRFEDGFHCGTFWSVGGSWLVLTKKDRRHAGHAEEAFASMVSPSAGLAP
jgi:hypothetical protein